MYPRPGPPVPIPPPTPFDPVALAGRFGAPVALLVTPESLSAHGGTLGESVHRPGPAGPMLPVYAIVQHRFDNEDPYAEDIPTVADVWTRRQQPGIPVLTVRDLVHQAQVQFRLESAAARGVPIRPGTQPEGFEEALSRRLDGWRLRSVTVDGELHRWECATHVDLIIDEEIMVVGGEIGTTSIAVVGPSRLLAAIELTLVHPQ